MVVPTWEHREGPLLSALAVLEEEQPDRTRLDLDDAGRRVGLEPDVARRIAARLVESGHLDGVVHRVGSGERMVIVSRLTAEGLRAANIWPNPGQDSSAAFLATLMQLIEDERDPERQSLMRRLLGSLREVGTPVLSEVIAAYLKHVTGM